MTANEIINLAKKELGYHEKASNKDLDNKTANSGTKNYTKYARDLYLAGYYNGNKNGYNWCAVFVDWLFYKVAGSKDAASLVKPCGIYGASCTWTKKYYNQNDAIVKDPKPGDQVFFQTDGSICHTGIVIAVNDTTITTIEGNCRDQVMRCTYKRTSTYINSYGRPFYNEKAKDVPFNRGDKVVLCTEYYSNGKHIASSVLKHPYVFVISDDGTNCRISKFETLAYTGTVKHSDLKKYI